MVQLKLSGLRVFTSKAVAPLRLLEGMRGCAFFASWREK